MQNGNPPPASSTGQAARSRGRPSLAEAAAIDAQLLDAAFREFCRNGYGGTSMRTIAREAKVSRTTLAARFANKAQLFQAIIRRQTERIDPLVSVDVDGPADLRHTLVSAGRALVAGCADGSLAHLYRLSAASSVQFPEIAELVVENDRVVMEQFAGFIARCAEVDGIACRDPRVPAHAFLMLVRGWALTFLMRGELAQADDSWVEPAIDALLASRPTW